VRVLVTGAGGFVAAHLIHFLRTEEPDVDVFGTERPQTSVARGPAGDVTSVEADLNDPGAAERVVKEVAPDRIVHLAGQSSVHRSWIEPGGTLRINVLGVVNLLDAVRRQGLRPAVLVVGSAEEYGTVDASEIPLKETTPLRPGSPYAVSKVAQASLAQLYGPAGGMRIVLTRTFPHTGPGRGESFAESSFARQIAEIEAGLKPPVLSVGNLDAIRDYSDVRDVVRAYWALLEKGEAGAVYNVCSGAGRTIRQMLDVLLGCSSIQVKVRVDPERLRRSDAPALVGDPTRLRADTGWRPLIPLERTLADLLDEWRERIKSTARPRPGPAS
jgi:GDP-4-dehydro-6-deoxy-D-mannose reductase